MIEFYNIDLVNAKSGKVLTKMDKVINFSINLLANLLTIFAGAALGALILYLMIKFILLLVAV